MSLAGPLDLLVSFLLVFTRLSAFLLIAPPFNSNAIPRRIRVLLGAAIALPIAGLVATDDPPLPDLSSLWPLVAAIGWQVLVGLTLGFIVLVAFSAIQAAGNLMDLFSMFAMAAMLDPISNTQSSVFGRLQYLIGTTLLFASGGHLLFVRGLMSTFEVAPLQAPDLRALEPLLINEFGRLLLAAVEIGGPVLACLFLADVALGLVSRSVPSLNVFQLSFPIKVILAVSLASVAVAMLPAAVNGIVERVLLHFQPALQILGG
ncbi:flagellar biosynthetic protein FliR [Kineosphaera limosa]|uniref:Putative flagellar biosynthetic protein FliR n=1 Tax=Kineosphaera limosa NBRC 100340 TaxID=1184609 RepID=K6WUX5_9MICO|nr:flagellar biosynthetic protein FliR [Kineosphaera limosa]NYD99786.1 flagellar biosynthetic protein FliR [Kineosphaera limosa]GAB95887.1 putative flagellar biosynthetic protein FliR [Kineosphaera limosa NBRC 100340]